MTVRTVYVYLAADGWRWRLKSRNGRILADSGEAYKKRSAAVKGAKTAFAPLPSIRLRVEGVPGWDALND
jgi:uncharacterized protein YegP (UPF0339 family)